MITLAEEGGGEDSLFNPNLKSVSKPSLLIGTLNMLSSAAFGLGVGSIVRFYSANSSLSISFLLGFVTGVTTFVAVSLFQRTRLRMSLKARLIRRKKMLLNHK